MDRRERPGAGREHSLIGRVLQIVTEAAALKWMDSALCSEVGGDEWFPAKGESVIPAKSVCAACDVRAVCLEYALDHPELRGIWGGQTEAQRKTIRQRRNTQGRAA